MVGEVLFVRVFVGLPHVPMSFIAGKLRNFELSTASCCGMRTSVVDERMLW